LIVKRDEGEPINSLRIDRAPSEKVWAKLVERFQPAIGSSILAIPSANACAWRLSSGLSKIGQAKLMAPTQANAVFATLPQAVLDDLKEKGWRFYTFIGSGARFMCAWDTTEADVDRLLEDVGRGCRQT
jgi:hypothetical protein